MRHSLGIDELGQEPAETTIIRGDGEVVEEEGGRVETMLLHLTTMTLSPHRRVAVPRLVRRHGDPAFGPEPSVEQLQAIWLVIGHSETRGRGATDRAAVRGSTTTTEKEAPDTEEGRGHQDLHPPPSPRRGIRVPDSALPVDDKRASYFSHDTMSQTIFYDVHPAVKWVISQQCY